MKKFLWFLLILLIHKIVAQNKQIGYDFAELPQTLLLNPASETNYKFHIGLPLLSGFSTEIRSTGFVLSDVFAEDNRNINDKIATLISTVDANDFLKINTQIEVVSVGFRLNNKMYLSFGFYQELDAIGYFPKDFLVLFTEGNNQYINRNFSISQVNYKLDLFGVFHAGISKKMNEKLTLGARLKIYSSSINFESKNNTGTFTTVEDSNNLYTHYFNNFNATFRTSGFIDANTNQYLEDPTEYVKNTFFGGNLGLGFDFGVTYHINSQLKFSASILDLGYIHHKKNIKNTRVAGNFVFEGTDFLFETADSANDWDSIDERFEEDFPRGDNQEAYISWRSTKINAALKYSFGQRRSKVCYDHRYKDFYTDALGVQLFSVFRPLGPQLALTSFYEKSITDKIHTKFTYTIDEFSYTNIGAGLSAQLGKLNVYTMLDNILSYKNLSSANHVSLQVGFNLIFE